MRQLPRKDVVIVGLGWTGAIMGHELTQAGLQVVAIERGPWRDTASDFNIGTAPDELSARTAGRQLGQVGQRRALGEGDLERVRDVGAGPGPDAGPQHRRGTAGPGGLAHGVAPARAEAGRTAEVREMVALPTTRVPS